MQLNICSFFNRATSAAAYQTGQAGYAVTPAATAATYTQRPAAAAATGYETYQAAAAAAATGTTYAGKLSGGPSFTLPSLKMLINFLKEIY